MKTIHTYVHQARIGVLMEVSCATDFAARTQLFTDFCRDLCMQVAAMNPADVGALLAQGWVKTTDSTTTGALVARVSGELGETVEIERFVRMEGTP